MSEAVGVPEQRAEVQHWTLKLWSPMDTADGKGFASTTTMLSRVVPRRNGGLLEGRISGRGRREVRARPIKETKTWDPSSLESAIPNWAESWGSWVD